MCGIAGVFDSGRPVQLSQVRQATGVMRHRGPDGEGHWQNPVQSVALGHRRLAIIDLSPAGAQPMHDASGQLAITFNGEIYNYRELRRELTPHWEFRSGSDTEVLLAGYRCWGVQVLSRLVGMFAFALWDESRRELFLARDRCGEKPLYYYVAGRRFSFASEVKGLLEDPGIPRRLDWDSAREFFRTGYLTGEATVLQGVRRLEPAHAMLVSEEGVRKWRYWELPEHAPAPVPDDEDLLAEFESLLADAVARQMVADVPVGVLLSGGVDSSLIAALACRTASRRVRTFTISFPEEPQLDESAHARLVADHFATEHVELEGRVGGPEILPELARQFDEPLGDSSQIPTLLVSRLARQHCTVALGGDGGDELFGGYRHYNRLTAPRPPATAAVRWVRNALARSAQGWVPFGVRGRNYLMEMASGPGGGPLRTARLFDDCTLARLVGPERARRTAAAVDESGATTESPLWREQARDFHRYLPGDILTKVDRASMLASLEVRAPFLDHRLVEFAFSKLPDRLKATATERKILPKRLAEKLLPPAFDRQRKQGFSIPMKRWLTGTWGAFMFEVLESAPGDLFSPACVRSLIAGQRAGRSSGEALFALTMFELWRREYRIAC